MKILDLRKGFGDFEDYKLFKFPGGEIHFVYKEEYIAEEFEVITRINNADDFLALCIVVDTIHKMIVSTIVVHLHYMPYQQADRDFAERECFSLKTIAKLLNSLPVDGWVLHDPHSDVTPALLNAHIDIRDNSEFIHWVISEHLNMPMAIAKDDLVLMSPDAGAYKKISKLAKKLEFKGQVISASKYRNTENGDIESIVLPTQPFHGRDILIIDDICMGGRTFIGLAKELQNRNVGKLYLAVSHMIFKKPNEELFKYFDVIFTTDSREDAYDAPEQKLQIFRL